MLFGQKRQTAGPSSEGTPIKSFSIAVHFDETLRHSTIFLDLV